MSWFKKIFNKEEKESLDQGLEKSRTGFFENLTKAVVGKSKVDDEVLDDLEEILIASDVGAATTIKIIERIEARAARDKYVNTNELDKILREEITDLLLENPHSGTGNIDETKNSPLAKQLFYLPFVKSVYISGNFIAIEKFSIVEWEDVQDDVAKQIEDFIAKGGEIILEETTTKKNPVTIYAESTPNPAVTKFVANKKLTNTAIECKNIDQTKSSP